MKQKTIQYDEYMITDLLGFSVTKEEKTDLLQAYNELILNRFFTQELPTHLSPEEMRVLQPVLLKEGSPKEKMTSLVNVVAELEGWLEEYASTQKKTFLLDLYASKLKDCEAMYSPSLTPEKKQEIGSTYDSYAHAISLLSQDLWDDLYIHWHPEK